MKWKQIEKKMLSLLLIVALLFTVQGIPILAETGKNEENAGEIKALPSNPVHHCMKDDEEDNDENDRTDWGFL